MSPPPSDPAGWQVAAMLASTLLAWAIAAWRWLMEPVGKGIGPDPIARKGSRLI